jgi:hypothetical protein
LYAVSGSMWVKMQLTGNLKCVSCSTDYAVLLNTYRDSSKWKVKTVGHKT